MTPPCSAEPSPALSKRSLPQYAEVKLPVSCWDKWGAGSEGCVILGGTLRKWMPGDGKFDGRSDSSRCLSVLFFLLSFVLFIL